MKLFIRNHVAITSQFLLVAAVGVLLGFICGAKRGGRLDGYSGQIESPAPPLTLLKTIWKEASRLYVFPADVVAYYGRFHDVFQLQESDEKEEIQSIRRRENSTIKEFVRRYGNAPIFNWDRRLDLTKENYAPLSHVLTRAQSADDEEIDECVEYLERANEKEKALILAVVYRSIETKYRAGRSVLEPPNRLKRRDAKRVAELKAIIEKYATSSEIVVGKWAWDEEETLRQWQSSLRENYLLLHGRYAESAPLLTLGGRNYYKRFVLSAPDYVLFSHMLLETDQEVADAVLPYYRGSLILADSEDNSNAVPPREKPVRELIDDEFAYLDEDVEAVPSPFGFSLKSSAFRIEPIIFNSEPLRVPSGTELLITDDRFVDDLREYLMTQFLALRLGNRRGLSAARSQEARNGVVYPNEVSLGEIATALLAGLDEIENPPDALIAETPSKGKNPQKKK